MITFSFHPDCEAEKKSYHCDLYIVDKIQAWNDGQSTGYLKMIHINSSRLKNIKSIWHYKSTFDGWCLNLLDLNKLWIDVHCYASRSPESCPNISPHLLENKHLPSPEIRDQDLFKLSKYFLIGLKNF